MLKTTTTTAIRTTPHIKGVVFSFPFRFRKYYLSVSFYVSRFFLVFFLNTFRSIILRVEPLERKKVSVTQNLYLSAVPKLI